MKLHDGLKPLVTAAVAWMPCGNRMISKTCPTMHNSHHVNEDFHNLGVAEILAYEAFCRNIVNEIKMHSPIPKTTTVYLNTLRIEITRN